MDESPAVQKAPAWDRRPAGRPSSPGRQPQVTRRPRGPTRHRHGLPDSGSGRPSRLPTLITAAVLFVVVGRRCHSRDYVAHLADTHASAPAVSKQPLPQVSALRETGSSSLPPTEVVSWILLRHSWVSYGQAPPTSGSYLRVEVELRSGDSGTDLTTTRTTSKRSTRPAGCSRRRSKAPATHAAQRHAPPRRPT